MSTMLEQAIVDAKALKEAAIKNAESALIEKYADNIRDAVDSLLEQEEEITEAEEDMGMDLAMDVDPAAATPDSGDAPPAAADGENLCPCPEKEDVVVIDFDDLAKAVEKEEYEKAAKIAKVAYQNGTTLKEEAIKSKLLSEKDYEKIVNPKKMIKPY